MNIWQDTSKVPAELQAELAEYRLFRDKAIDKTSDLSGVKFFGIVDKGDERTLRVADDLSSLDNDTLNSMQLAVVAPDNETFDMLASKDFTKKLKLNTPANLRRFLLKLLDSIP